MASPSAPTCVVMATRSRVFKKSATSRIVLFLVRARIFSRLFSNVFQCRLDPAHVLHNRIRFKPEPGRAFEARLFPDRGLNASGRALQSLSSPFEVLAREDAVEDSRLSQVRAHPDTGDRNEALNARVRERPDLLADDLLQLRLDLTGTPAHDEVGSLKALRTPPATPVSPDPRSSARPS